MLILIGVIFLLLLLNGFFSGSEIAVISIRRSKIDELVATGRRSARRLKHLHENLDDFLATVQIGVTLMGTLAGVIGGYLAKRQKGVDAEIIEIAWKAQHRLHSRYKKLLAAGKNKPQIVTAVGREMLGFIWAIAVKTEAKYQSQQKAAA